MFVTSGDQPAALAASAVAGDTTRLLAAGQAGEPS